MFDVINSKVQKFILPESAGCYESSNIFCGYTRFPLNSLWPRGHIYTVQFLTDFSWFLLCRIEKHYVITPHNWFLNALSTLLPVLWQLKSEVALGGRWKPRSKTAHIAHQDQVATRIEQFWHLNPQLSYVRIMAWNFILHTHFFLDLIKVLKF